MATEFVKRGEGLPRPRDLQSIIAEGPSREDPRIDWKTAVISILDVRAPRTDRR
jgi:hypothetical protein